MSEGIRPTRAKYDALAEATKKWKAGMAAEEAWLSVDGWKDEILGTTYEGGPCPGVEIADAYRGGGIPMKSHNRIELKPDPDAAYQDDVRRG